MTFSATLATFPLPTPKYRVIRGIKGGITTGKNDVRDSFSFSHTNLVIAGGIKSGIKMRKKGRCKCLAFGHGIKGGIKRQKK